jgi:hypothetical protein
MRVKSRANQGVSHGDLGADQSNTENYESACPWDIYSLKVADEMLDRRRRMAREDMEDLHMRIARVTEDLRKIQQELNCAAMQAPSDPELMEALNSLAETEPIETLRVALDQMRHFLWFYMQVVTSDSEMGEKFRQTLRQDARVRAPEMEQQFQSATDAIMLRYLADSKFRKPN